MLLTMHYGASDFSELVPNSVTSLLCNKKPFCCIWFEGSEFAPDMLVSGFKEPTKDNELILHCTFQLWFHYIINPPWLYKLFTSSFWSFLVPQTSKTKSNMSVLSSDHSWQKAMRWTIIQKKKVSAKCVHPCQDRKHKIYSKLSIVMKCQYYKWIMMEKEEMWKKDAHRCHWVTPKNSLGYV